MSLLRTLRNEDVHQPRLLGELVSIRETVAMSPDIRKRRVLIALALSVTLSLVSFGAGWTAGERRFRRAARNVRRVQRELFAQRDALRDLASRKSSPSYAHLRRVHGGLPSFPHRLDGVVLRRRHEEIEISVGSDDAIQAGDYCLVFIDSELAACVRIQSLKPDTAIGRVVLDQGPAIAPGDRVIAYANLTPSDR